MKVERTATRIIRGNNSLPFCLNAVVCAIVLSVHCNDEYLPRVLRNVKTVLVNNSAAPVFLLLRPFYMNKSLKCLSEPTLSQIS